MVGKRLILFFSLGLMVVQVISILIGWYFDRSTEASGNLQSTVGLLGLLGIFTSIAIREIDDRLKGLEDEKKKQ